MSAAYKIRSYETDNYQYHFVTIAKTSYEQQQERRERFMYMLKQRGLVLLFILAMFILSCISKSALGSEANAFWIISLCIGIPVLLTNKRVIG